MTYFGFLLRFLMIPILLLAALVWAGRKRLSLRGLPFATGVHMILALLYTTPWDNYLVATGVWYYNPALISGFLLGYVPLEEYTFFVLQTILVGLWWGLLASRLAPTGGFQPSARLRRSVSLAVGLLWLISAISIPERVEARHLSFHHTVLGAASHSAPTDLWRRYPLAFPEASGCRHTPDRCISFLGGLACHHRHHLGDPPRTIAGDLSRPAPAGGRHLLLYHGDPDNLWDDAAAGR